MSDSDPKREELDEVFASIGSDDVEGDELTDELLTDEVLPDEFETDWPAEDAEEHRPLQFSLSALFAGVTLAGLFLLAYAYQRAFGFLLFFAVATAVAARTRGKRERMVATMFFGGGAAICGGLMMAEAGRPAIAISGLIIACLGGYASLHGVALVVASFWE